MSFISDSQDSSRLMMLTVPDIPVERIYIEKKMKPQICAVKMTFMTFSDLMIYRNKIGRILTHNSFPLDSIRTRRV